MKYDEIDPIKRQIENQYGAKVRSEFDTKVGDNLCDFCSDPNPIWDYKCHDYIVDTITPPKDQKTFYVRVSRDDWAACQVCAEMIESKRWHDLSMRSATKIWVRSYQMKGELADVYQRIRKVHATFREHFTGERETYIPKSKDG